jgi:glycine/D-amino acid oxidase-like deaminating enzyme
MTTLIRSVADPVSRTTARPGATLSGAPDQIERTDVLVIGGGIAGASAAFHIARAGIRVTLLERGRVAQGVTGRAVGVFSPPVRQSYQQLVFDLGADAARAVWELSRRSVDGLSDLIRSRGDAEAAQLDAAGGHVLAEPHTREVVLGSFEALLAAEQPVRWLTPRAVADLTGGRRFSGGYVVEGGGAVDPGAAARSVIGAARSAGAHVVERCAAYDIAPCADGFHARTDLGEIVAHAVVYATHVDGGGFLGDSAALLTPVRGQAFVTAPVPRRFDGAFSTEWKTNVWRQRPDGRIVVSGWRHHTADRARRADAPELDLRLQHELRWWFDAAFPELAPLPVESEWSGVWTWTPDMLPVAGALPGRPGEWVIGGFGSEGLAFAFEAGRAVAHAIVGDAPVDGAERLDPARFAHRTALAAGE